ncbi:RNA methyltransferase [Bartonella sp. HY329]|uniref:TrmH family RNA methyltransferase n=1 Tax=unclassified Bartonella TaxID=2645622 RepID=UPI0021C83FBE|nr:MULTISPECIES: RNA methyltransferase [unclassified Bartonella]UXM94160.1 RNA methyltransferase [Bartonella sp. HY329]UXN08482.1 RNA methyltransferase [Bartonella sp. HY328]
MTTINPIIIENADDVRIADYMNVKEKDLVGRNDLFIAEGRVVLNVLLNSTIFEAQSILIAQNRLNGLLPLLEGKAAHCPIYVASQDVIDAIAGFHLHRGILAIGQRKRPATLDEFLDDLPPQALLVLLCGISNHDNIGGIFRNSAAFAADGVILDETCCDPLYRKAIRVSVGAALKIPHIKSDNIFNIIDKVQNAGFEVFAFSPSSQQKLLDSQPAKRTALLFGTEGEGLPHQILQQFKTLRIPMAADFDSLNVATAAAIALSHFAVPERIF